MKVECSKCKRKVHYTAEIKSSNSFNKKYYCLFKNNRVGIRFKSNSPEGILFICENCINKVV